MRGFMAIVVVASMMLVFASTSKASLVRAQLAVDDERLKQVIYNAFPTPTTPLLPAPPVVEVTNQFGETLSGAHAESLYLNAVAVGPRRTFRQTATADFQDVDIQFNNTKTLRQLTTQNQTIFIEFLLSAPGFATGDALSVA